MTFTNTHDAAQNLIDMANAGKIIQGDWGDWGDGYETACFYSALVPGAEGTEDCPAWLMPQWFADLVPWIDDKSEPEDAIPNALALGLALQAGVKDWDSLRFDVLALCVRKAWRSAERVVDPEASYWPAVDAVCKDVIAACEARDGKRLKAAWPAAYAAEHAPRAADACSAAAAPNAAWRAAKTAVYVSGWPEGAAPLAAAWARTLPVDIINLLCEHAGIDKPERGET